MSTNNYKKENQIRFVISLIAIVTVLLLISITILIISSVSGNGGNTTTTTPSGKVKYEEISKSSDSVHEGDLVLVNSANKYSFPESEQSAVASVFEYNHSNSTVYAEKGEYAYSVAFTTISLREPALSSVHKMLEAFYKENNDNGTVIINSAHRTFDEQAAIGSSIKAGFSDSHTGLGFSAKIYANGYTKSLSSDETAYAWLQSNCYKYGFIVRYPDGKEGSTGVSDYNYYFRYVGYPHAYYMTHNSPDGVSGNTYSFEEYVNYLKEFNYDGNHLGFKADNGHSYEIYYVPAGGEITSLNVPTNYDYTVSGNNVDGFIITITLS